MGKGGKGKGKTNQEFGKMIFERFRELGKDLSTFGKDFNF